MKELIRQSGTVVQEERNDDMGQYTASGDFLRRETWDAVILIFGMARGTISSVVTVVHGK